MPCLANLFGTVKRVALGVTLGGEPRTTAGELREVGELLAFLRQPEPPRGIKDAMELLPLAQTVMSMRPKVVKKAPVQELVFKGDQIDLTRLPVQTCWPGEPAPLITWPLIVTKGPSDSKEDDFNLGIYRMQVLGKDRAIKRWLRLFLTRFFANQFKRSAVPNGPKISSGGALSPRGDWRMPSDA
eukprot:gene67798-92892_t